MRKLNKRGMLDDVFDLIFIVAGAFVILLFVNVSVMGSLRAEEKQILNNLKNLEGGEQFLVFLRSQVEFEGRNWLLQDFILYALESNQVSKDKFKEIVAGQIKSYFPEPSLCGYSFAFKQNKLYEGKELSSYQSCPYLSLNFVFPNKEVFFLEMGKGRIMERGII